VNETALGGRITVRVALPAGQQNVALKPSAKAQKLYKFVGLHVDGPFSLFAHGQELQKDATVGEQGVENGDEITIGGRRVKRA
jgi:hypothetical protein